MAHANGRLVVGIDLGGTKIAGGVVDARGGLLAHREIPTEADGGRDHVIGRIVDLVRELEGEASRPPRCVGIGAPAPLSPSRGIVWEAPNLPGWERVPLREILTDRLGLPVALENDARAAALAELHLGAGRGATEMLFIAVGTGIGGALVIGGRLHRGASETAGEIGHMVMVPDGPPCGCGNRGCLEQFSAGPAIARRALELVRGGAPSTLQELPEAAVTGEAVAAAARRGDAVGLQAYREAGAWLGAAIASVANLVNPSLVVIGGGVAETGDLLLQPAREAAARHTLRRALESLRIVPAALGNEAGVLGAALAALDLLDRSDRSGAS